MPRFPVDAPKSKVLRALERLGFRMVREGEHISMLRANSDGINTPPTMPNHRTIKGSTFDAPLPRSGASHSDARASLVAARQGRTICTHAAISRAEFLEAFGQE